MSRHTQNVLLVEDDPAARILIERILSRDPKENYQLEMVADLAAATSLLSERKFDALILDLNLPDSRGLETIALVRDVDPAVPIVVQSAHDDQQIGLQCIEQGADFFLVKGDYMQRRLPRSIRYAANRRKTMHDAQPQTEPQDSQDGENKPPLPKNQLKSQLKKVKQAMAVSQKSYKPLDYLS